MRRLILSCCAMSTGCAFFRTAADRVEGVLDPLVAIGVVTLAEPPDEAALREVDLAALGLGVGVGATVFLADARSVDDLAQAPLAGQEVTVRGCGDALSLEDGGDGSYSLLPPSELDGCGGPAFELRRADPERPTVMPVTIPSGANVRVPLTHTAGDPLVLDLSASGFDSVLVAVVDVEAGELTWSNEPDGIAAWYRFLTGKQAEDSLTVPAAAFRDDTAHAVGVIGFERTRNVALEHANEALSVVAGGRLTLHPLLTFDPETDTAW